LVIATSIKRRSRLLRRYAELPRSFSDRTSISAGIDFSLAQFERSPFSSERHIIDVSGDGTNNSGRDITAARDDALAKGVTTINGLVILSEVPSPYNPEHTNPPGGLGNYYRNVVGGEDVFVIVAENFASFGKAILAKLIRGVSLNGQTRSLYAGVEGWTALAFFMAPLKRRRPNRSGGRAHQSVSPGRSPSHTSSAWSSW
jgi:hypothetical protein